MAIVSLQAPADQSSYVRDYIKAALTGDALDAPDRTQADGDYETLVSLYETHGIGGKVAARKAFDTAKRFRPALAELDPETPVAFSKPDDDMIAGEMAREISEQAAFFYSQWRIYDGGCWRAQQPYEFRRYVRGELRRFRNRGVVVSQTRIKALASMLEDDLFVPDRAVMEKQREQVKYINLRNGLFNLETMQIEDHRPELYFTTQLDFDYNPKATCVQFQRYLRSSLVYPDGRPDESLIRRTLQALAYSMTARTDLKASFWLYGGKDTGKSTFIALIKALMGDLHTTIDLTQLGVNKFILAGMVGRRVVTFSEGDSNTVLPDALYKNLTGGSDEIFADVKNRDPIVFRPEAKIWWAMNNMPRINDRSGATTRRIIMIPFKRTIPESARIHDLEYKLMGERSGIFNLVMDHLIELNELGGFSPCEQSEQLRQEYILENDTEATYLEERCEQREDYRVRGAELYRDYALWCEEGGFKPKNANQIAKEWRRFNFELFHSNGKWWRGLKLREFQIQK